VLPVAGEYRIKKNVRIMEQQEISFQVKALWLKYYETSIECPDKNNQVVNAARGPITVVQMNTLPKTSSFMIAT
jgi:hypothetical protein